MKSVTRFSLVSGGFGPHLASVPGLHFLSRMSNLHHISLFSWYSEPYHDLRTLCKGVWQWQIFDLHLTLVPKALGHSFPSTCSAFKSSAVKQIDGHLWLKNH